MPAEPTTLTLSDHPARWFAVSNESDFVAQITVEYRGGGWWRAQLDTGAPRTEEHGTYRSLADTQRWAAATMEEQAAKARATCECGTDGEDTSGNGNFACGVLSPHGISTTITDADGCDVTDDYRLNRM